MPRYDLHVLCPECHNFHDLLARVTLEESFEVRNARDAYNGEIPPELLALINQECPLTGKRIEQPNPDALILVEVGRWQSNRD